MLTNSDHQSVQSLVHNASAEERLELKQNAETTLVEARRMMDLGPFPADVRKQIEIAVEILVRLEALEQRGGWWFRSKRRIQLTHMYLGG